MKLTVAERIIIGNILPSEGNFVTLRVIRDLRNNLSFSDEELAKLSFKGDGNSKIFWDSVAEQEMGPKEVEIGQAALGIIRDALLKLDREGRLTEQMLDVYERFLGVEA